MFSQACVGNSRILSRGVSVPACTTGHMTRGISVWGSLPGGLCLGGGLFPGGSLSGGLCLSLSGGLCLGGSLSGGHLSRDVSVHWVSVQGGLC